MCTHHQTHTHTLTPHGLAAGIHSNSAMEQPSGSVMQHSKHKPSNNFCVMYKSYRTGTA